MFNYHTNAIPAFEKFGTAGVILRSFDMQNGLTDDEIQRRAPSVFAEQAHERCSDRYVYLSTRETLAGMRKEGFFPMEVRQNGAKDVNRRSFAKHMIRFRRQNPPKVGDSVPEVILGNSHDLTSNWFLYLGWFRLVCLNGMVTANDDKESDGIKVRHSGKVLDRVIEASYKVIDQAEHSGHLIEDMTRVNLSHDEQIAFADAARSLRFDEADIVSPESIIRANRAEDIGTDLWRTFNRVQENLVRGGVRYKQVNQDTGKKTNRHVREAKAIDGNLKLNRALWILAEEMRKLKAA